MAESNVNVTEGSGKKLHTWNRTIGANSVEDEFTLLGEYPLATYSARADAVSTATAASHLIQVMAGASLAVYVRKVTVTQHTIATTAAASRFQLLRVTTAGTGGTVSTPTPYDTGDAASGATTMTLPTVKGTEGAIFGQWSFYSTQTVPTSGLSAPGFTIDFTGYHAKSPRLSAGAANGIVLKNIDGLAGMAINIVVEFVEANF